LIVRSACRVVWTLVGVVLLTGVAGCREGSNPPRDPELARELGLSERAEIHRIDLVTRSSGVLVFPIEVEVARRGYVQFVTQDWRVYQVTLEGEGPEAVQWLESSRQRRSPPLVELDTRYVVQFEGAPVGEYRFIVQGPVGSAEGVIRVR
jgi:hypothetical protein